MPTILGDRLRLRQLFLNLVTNAIKYTSRGGTVELTVKRKDGEVLFSVRDTGIGIAAGDLPYIFERFWRADRARSRLSERGGFGLGLAISQWIAQAHGGTLTVQSRLHRGSTFTVSLPIAPDDAVADVYYDRTSAMAPDEPASGHDAPSRHTRRRLNFAASAVRIIMRSVGFAPWQVNDPLTGLTRSVRT